MSLRGITEKKMKNGTTAIMVRFKFDSTTYPVKNFTKLYGCETRTGARKKLDEIKVAISQGIEPFINTPYTLDDIWYKRVEYKRTNKEWKDITCKNYTYYYEAHIKPLIGKKKLSKITVEHLEKIIKDMNGLQGGTKNRLQKILYPIFDDAIKRNQLNFNVAKDLKRYKIGNDKNIKLRSGNKQLNIVKKLYLEIPNYNVHQKSQEQEIKMFLYMVILTAHRIGELLQLKKENVIMDERKIISPPEITKTQEEYHFPIPKECLSYIKSIKSGLLFPTLKRGSLYNIYQRLVKKTDISFYKGKTISPHDMRRMILTIMIIDCNVDSMLADSCLSHKQSGSAKHYVNFDDEHIRDAYQKYWDIIALSKEKYDEKYNRIITVNPSLSNKIDITEKLIQLGKLVNDGLLTKEEFNFQKESLLKNI